MLKITAAYNQTISITPLKPAKHYASIAVEFYLNDVKRYCEENLENSTEVYLNSLKQKDALFAAIKQEHPDQFAQFEKEFDDEYSLILKQLNESLLKVNSKNKKNQRF